MVSTIDRAISLAVNSSVGLHPWFDSLVYLVGNNYLLKSAPLVAAFWFLWWSVHTDRKHGRSTLLMVLAACFATMVVVRSLTKLLPFRLRPIAESGLGLTKVPEMAGTDWFDTVSSLPSDTAALFFALAFGLLVVSRPVGLLALLHAAIIVALPRLYLGLHYPTDLLAGALVGITVTWLFTREKVVEQLGLPAHDWLRRHPALAYAALFLVTSEMASMFEPLRAIGGFARDALLMPSGTQNALQSMLP